MMRILIGYNGSAASTAALEDLHFAGLPNDSEVVILTVAESWSKPKNPQEARRLATDGVTKTKQSFPGWTVSGETAMGSPPREILARAESFHPDLIVVGEPRHDPNDHSSFVGHTSHVILTESASSIRIARGATIADQHPERILIGFDGSFGSLLAAETIAARNWSSGVEVRLLAVADSSVLSSIGRFAPEMTNAVVEARFASQWAETLAAASTATLLKAGIASSVVVRLGVAKDEIVAEAEQWKADSVFVGPHCAGNSFERFLIGSVSAAVAARAHCSVEVVRRREP